MLVTQKGVQWLSPPFHKQSGHGEFGYGEKYKQNFWKKGHPVATYPYKSNLQYD